MVTKLRGNEREIWRFCKDARTHLSLEASKPCYNCQQWRSKPSQTEFSIETWDLNARHCIGSNARHYTDILPASFSCGCQPYSRTVQLTILNSCCTVGNYFYVHLYTNFVLNTKFTSFQNISIRNYCFSQLVCTGNWWLVGREREKICKIYNWLVGYSL